MEELDEDQVIDNGFVYQDRNVIHYYNREGSFTDSEVLQSRLNRRARMKQGASIPLDQELELQDVLDEDDFHHLHEVSALLR